MTYAKILFKTINHPNFYPELDAAKIARIPNLWSFYYETPKGNMIFPHEEGSSVLIGASTKEEAQKFMEETNFSSDGFIVLKNADFTEGRGPMHYHKAFKDYDKAVSYIMQQEGIFGSPQYAENRLDLNISNEVFGRVNFNGYEIKAIHFADDSVVDYTKREKIEDKIKYLINQVNGLSKYATPANDLSSMLTLANITTIIRRIKETYNHEYSVADFIELVAQTKTLDALATQISCEIPHYDGEPT